MRWFVREDATFEFSSKACAVRFVAVEIKAMQRVAGVSLVVATQRLPPRSPFGTLARMRRSRNDMLLFLKL